jgi:hypothetical protein
MGIACVGDVKKASWLFVGTFGTTFRQCASVYEPFLWSGILGFYCPQLPAGLRKAAVFFGCLTKNLVQKRFCKLLIYW